MNSRHRRLAALERGQQYNIPVARIELAGVAPSLDERIRQETEEALAVLAAHGLLEPRQRTEERA